MTNDTLSQNLRCTFCIFWTIGGRWTEKPSEPMNLTMPDNSELWIIICQNHQITFVDFFVFLSIKKLIFIVNLSFCIIQNLTVCGIVCLGHTCIKSIHRPILFIVLSYPADKDYLSVNKLHLKCKIRSTKFIETTSCFPQYLPKLIALHEGLNCNKIIENKASCDNVSSCEDGGSFVFEIQFDLKLIFRSQINRYYGMLLLFVANHSTNFFYPNLRNIFENFKNLENTISIFHF